MSLSINLNSAAMSATRYLTANNNALGKSIERLSSGYRVNNASDDPAGLVISQKLRAQIGGLAQAITNSNDAINMVKTAEGALNETHSLLLSMRDLAVHAANVGTNDDASLAADQSQITSAIAAIDRISTNTQFGDTVLLDGTAGAAGDGVLDFQVGAYAGQTAQVTLESVAALDLSVNLIDVTTDAQAALTAIDAAITQVSTMRADLGAFQKNVLESNVNSLSIAKENIAASESSIRDTDMAAEMVNFTKSQILQQAGISMLAQANQAPQSLLKLLQ